jgi:hypothetical protein
MDVTEVSPSFFFVESIHSLANSDQMPRLVRFSAVLNLGGFPLFGDPGGVGTFAPTRAPSAGTH